MRVFASRDYRRRSKSLFKIDFFNDTLFFMNVSAMQQLSSLVESCKVSLNAFLFLCRGLLRLETNERLSCLVVVISTERANEDVGEGRLPTLSTVTGDCKAYFKRNSMRLATCISVDDSLTL